MRRFYFKLLKKLKIRFLLFINELIHPCRMVRKKKPDKPDVLCYLCAARGGWLRCKIPGSMKNPAPSNTDPESNIP